MKRCARCDHMLPEDRFNGNKRHRDGLQAYCKNCQRKHNEGVKRRTGRTPSQKNKLMRRYGITEQQYDDMLRAQGHRCRICRLPMPDPCIDHDHDTGAIRGILCRTCNTGIGGLRDDPAVCRAAAEYLETWRPSVLVV